MIAPSSRFSFGDDQDRDDSTAGGNSGGGAEGGTRGISRFIDRGPSARKRFRPDLAMTEGYRPGAGLAARGAWFDPRKPFFSLAAVDAMLADPTVLLGLAMIKGPIATCQPFAEGDPRAEIYSGPKILVKASRSDVAQFVAGELSRFWQGSLRKVLSAIEYGTSAGEVCYRLSEYDNRLYFDELRDVKLFDARVLTDKRTKKFCGISVQNVDASGSQFVGQKVQLFQPKAFWHMHDRLCSQWYGRSRLSGAFAPWWEKTTEGGANDVRKLWFYKNAYDSGTMRHPDGNSDIDGVSTPNRDIARQFVEERRTGYVGVLPSTRYPSIQGGGYLWETSNPTLNGSAKDVRENLKDIDKEILRGLGIPPEVVQADGTGSYSGRLVPQSAFFSSLEDMLSDLLATWRKLIGDPLVCVNFGRGVEYEISTTPLTPVKPKPATPPVDMGNPISNSDTRIPVSEPRPTQSQPERQAFCLVRDGNGGWRPNGRKTGR